MAVDNVHLRENGTGQLLKHGIRKPMRKDLVVTFPSLQAYFPCSIVHSSGFCGFVVLKYIT
jgi:hypothetical protein